MYNISEVFLQENLCLILKFGFIQISVAGYKTLCAICAGFG